MSNSFQLIKCENNEEIAKINFIHFKQISLENPNVLDSQDFYLFAVDSLYHCFLLHFNNEVKTKQINLNVIWKSAQFKIYEEYVSKLPEKS
jgi:hypothetical protein